MTSWRPGTTGFGTSEANPKLLIWLKPQSIYMTSSAASDRYLYMLSGISYVCFSKAARERVASTRPKRTGKSGNGGL